MKRNAVAVTVGALFIAPAAQAQIVFGNETIGTVQFYGKLYPQFGWARSSGATQPGESVSTLVSSPSGVLTGAAVSDTPSRQAVDSQNSYLGFRGERKFGSAGLKAIWQIEQSVNLTTGVGSTFSNRNSFVGLRSNFGTVKLGNMDTIYKEYGDTLRMFGISSGNFVSASNVLSHIGIGKNRAARFHERRANSIQLESAQYGGFTGGFQYSPDETKANNNVNASLYSYGVKWEGGPFYASLHQERHNDFFGGSNNIPATTLRNGTTTGTTPTFTPAAGAHSKDTGTRLSVEYRIGGHRLVGDIAQLEYKETSPLAAPRFESYKHTNWAIGWDARWGGPWRTAIQYVVGGEGACTLTDGTDCSTSGLKGTMLNVGVAYSLDRQTFLYGIAGRLTNGKSSLYTNWANADPQRGANVTQAAIGISYTF
jgi:predicted porin